MPSLDEKMKRRDSNLCLNPEKIYVIEEEERRRWNYKADRVFLFTIHRGSRMVRESERQWTSRNRYKMIFIIPKSVAKLSARFKKEHQATRCEDATWCPKTFPIVSRVDRMIVAHLFPSGTARKASERQRVTTTTTHPVTTTTRRRWRTTMTGTGRQGCL